MNSNIKKICVFASASNDLDNMYYEAAAKMGEVIGKNGYDLVYGGSHRGSMYAAAKAAKDNGSKIYAVMPEIFANREGFANPEDCEEFIVTKGMRERKAKLDEISDAVIAVAGGFGTLEEVSEMMVQKQLGYNHKPVVVLNTNGFYDDLVKFFDRMAREKFAKENAMKTYYVTNSPEDAINYINNYEPDYSLDRFAKLK